MAIRRPQSQSTLSSVAFALNNRWLKSQRFFLSVASWSAEQLAFSLN